MVFTEIIAPYEMKKMILYGKGSKAVFGYMTELAQAARKEAAHETVA